MFAIKNQIEWDFSLHELKQLAVGTTLLSASLSLTMVYSLLINFVVIVPPLLHKYCVWLTIKVAVWVCE